MPKDELDAELTSRRCHDGEHRLPPALAVGVAIAAYALLPDSLLIGPRFAIPAVEGLLLITVMVVNPVRLVRQTRWSRGASVVLAGIVIATDLGALAMLIGTVDSSRQRPAGLLIGGVQVWLTNVIGFALLFWELDRGGPVARRAERRDHLPPADWRFSQDENGGAVTEVAKTASEHSGWVPLFVDYLYLSVTNSSAFSPTDTMPLSTRAKLLMAAQATAALVVTLIIVARAVGSLGGG